MSLQRDLLEQAAHLAEREPRKPRQASLRRAISTAYYATFHLLVDEGAKLLASGTGMASLHRLFVRSFAHDEMKSVCQAVAAGNWPVKVEKNVGAISIPTELRAVADSFVDLQQWRHAADYDVMQRFTRSDVRTIVGTAGRLFDNWKVVRKESAARIFLASLFTTRTIRT